MDEFHDTIWGYYRTHARPMPWRDAPTFYNVLISELMLQQTQVSRVEPKFVAFTQRFPSMIELAQAPLADVMSQWVGLGYNRRAKYLHEASRLIVKNGQPRGVAELVALPGVGKNTAAAIMNYAYNSATPFVETNIRTVYIESFFKGKVDITDRQILDLVTTTIDYEHPREWFWALMDYGAHLKASGLANTASSHHYRRQTPLAGSVRQMRGWIVRALAGGALSRARLTRQFGDDARFTGALSALQSEGLVTETNGTLHLTK